MKRVLLLTAFSALFLAAYARPGEGIHLGYSCVDLTDPFQLFIVEAAKKEAAEADVRLTIVDSQENVERQRKQVDKMIADGVDALAVVPVDTAKVDYLVKAAAAAGIPLVFVNRNPFVGIRPPEDCFVIASDAYVEGETQMNFAGPLITASGGLGHVVILQGILNNEATQSRTRGVKDVIMRAYPDLGITAEATANWRRDQARVIMREWIKFYGREKIDAVLSNNDAMALGALDALEEVNFGGVVVMGVDGLPEALAAIKSGGMAGTVLQDGEAQGRGAVQIAARAIQGEAQPQNNILPSELITRKNVRAFQKN